MLTVKIEKKILVDTDIDVESRIIRHALNDEILLPKVRRKIIYDNGASLKKRGISFQRKRFEVHLKSWMGNFYKLMTRTQRKNLLELFETLFDKEITIINKKMVIKDKSDD